MKIVFRFGRCNIIIYSSIWDVPNERHADPAPQKSGKMEIFVPKDAQYSEIYVKTIFTEILKFYRLRKFEFQVSRIFSTKKKTVLVRFCSNSDLYASHLHTLNEEIKIYRNFVSTRFRKFCMYWGKVSLSKKPSIVFLRNISYFMFIEPISRYVIKWTKSSRNFHVSVTISLHGTKLCA